MNTYGFSSSTPEEIGEDWRKIFKWISAKQGRRRVWIGFIWLGIGTVAGSCDYDSRRSGSVNGREYLEVQNCLLGCTAV
jgi:hypothetical protein